MQLLIKVMQICNLWIADPPRLYCELTKCSAIHKDAADLAFDFDAGIRIWLFTVLQIWILVRIPKQNQADPDPLEKVLFTKPHAPNFFHSWLQSWRKTEVSTKCKPC
jgi:hypothetical protein